MNYARQVVYTDHLGARIVYCDLPQAERGPEGCMYLCGNWLRNLYCGREWDRELVSSIIASVRIEA